MSRDQIQRRLRRWAIPVALTVAISALVGLWIGRSTVPLYQATGKILVFAAPQQSSLGSILYVDVNQATKTTATLITTRPVLARAVADTESLEDAQRVLHARNVRTELDYETENHPARHPRSQLFPR